MPASPGDTRLSMQLADGRRLAYRSCGPTGGTPVLYCHGAIGTPVGATVDLPALCERREMRYLTPSRPGIGRSDPCPGRTIRSWAQDARQLVDRLGLEELHLLGVSAGGPYALALADLLGPRVRAVALVSSLSPLSAPHATPGLRRHLRYPLAAVHELPAGSGRGIGGLIADYRVFCGPWGFDLAGIDCPVQLWHGGRDPLVPSEHAFQLAAALPRCEIHCDPDAGHHFFRARLEQILDRLLAPAPALRLQRAA